MLVAAVPDDMRRYARIACDAGEALLDRLRRTAVPVLVSFPVAPGLEARLLRVLDGSCAVDHWVAELADAFGAADGATFIGPLRRGETVVDDTSLVAGTLVGCGLGTVAARRLVAPLTHREALAVGRVAAERVRAMTPALSDDGVRDLRRQLAPLRDKLREPYREPVATAYASGAASAALPAFPDDYGEVMVALAVPGPRKANFSGGLVSGMVAGSWDREGYDTAAGEFGRGAGHILSGLLIVGDVRDATADAWHHRWLDLGIDTVGLVPVFGDLAKGGRTGWKAGKGWRAASDTARDIQRSRQTVATTTRVVHNNAAEAPDCRT